MLFVLAAAEGFLKFGCELAALLVTSRVARGDHRSKIAKVELLDVGQGSFGPVAPFGGAQRREQFFGEGNERAGFDLGFGLGPQRGVLLVDGLAYRRNAPTQYVLRHRPVLGGQFGQDPLTVLATGAEPLGLRAWRRFRPGSAGWARCTCLASCICPIATGLTTRAIATLASGSSGTLATGTLAAGTVTPRPIASWTVTPRTVATSFTVTSTPAVVTRAIASVPRRQLGRHGLERALGDELDPFGRLTGALGCEDAEHRDPVEVEFCVGAQHDTDTDVGWKQRAVHDTFRLAGTGGAPGPGSVGLGTGEFDLDPARHGREP